MRNPRTVVGAHCRANRGILLIFYDDERIRRMCRTLCVVDDAVEQLARNGRG